ncbi:uncharacterized protein LOC135431338 isoform X18 [Drosophila montana]|uniref:uncharacterized protein LOC135431338 isoform X18 n=1 Tax=Drosophila montana TaxID=40370 RepID=UPI00313E9F4C
MGQTSSHRQSQTQSSHNNNNKDDEPDEQFASRRTSARKSKSSKHYATLVQQPLHKDELSILRDSLLRNGSIMRKNMNDPQRRPVTISELKPQSQASAVSQDYVVGGGAAESNSTTNLISFQLPIDCSAKVEDVASASAAAAASKETRNEFYIVGDGYHKTDYCHYRTPNGNFHKLPTDSFHKMSEGCFVRMADGVFRRLELPTKAQQVSCRASKLGDISGADSNENGLGATSVKRQLLNFLKRSKSHTPATIAKLQKDKDDARLERKQRLSNAMRQKALQLKTTSATGAKLNTPNNKIVVTMIENGGLPIVATSKADRPKCKDSASVAAEKARTSRCAIAKSD